MRGNYTNDISRHVKALNTIHQNDVVAKHRTCHK